MHKVLSDMCCICFLASLLLKESSQTATLARLKNTSAECKSLANGAGRGEGN